MPQSVDASKTKLIEDFNAVIEDAEQLLKSLAASGSEKGSALRASAERNLESARERLRELQGDALERSRAPQTSTCTRIRGSRSARSPPSPRSRGSCSAC